jgi:hypothetical protein
MMAYCKPTLEHGAGAGVCTSNELIVSEGTAVGLVSKGKNFRTKFHRNHIQVFGFDNEVCGQKEGQTLPPHYVLIS